MCVFSSSSSSSYVVLVLFAVYVCVRVILPLRLPFLNCLHCQVLQLPFGCVSSTVYSANYIFVTKISSTARILKRIRLFKKPIAKYVKITSLLGRISEKRNQKLCIIRSLTRRQIHQTIRTQIRIR